MEMMALSTGEKWGKPRCDGLKPAPINGFLINVCVLRSRRSRVRIAPSPPSYLPTDIEEFPFLGVQFQNTESAEYYGKTRVFTAVDAGKMGETPSLNNRCLTDQFSKRSSERSFSVSAFRRQSKTTHFETQRVSGGTIA